jgi:hypothetical protein
VRAATETLGMAIIAETELLTRDTAPGAAGRTRECRPGLPPPEQGLRRPPSQPHSFDRRLMELTPSHPNILGGHPSTLVSVFRGSAPFRTKAFDQLV